MTDWSAVTPGQLIDRAGNLARVAHDRSVTNAIDLKTLAERVDELARKLSENTETLTVIMEVIDALATERGQ